jgi:transposase
LRGADERTGALFSYVDLDARVRKDHPLRVIRTVVNEALVTIEREIASLYSGTGRPSIAPERLLRAMLLQAFYSIRSERQLMERMEFDLLFRWFVGLGIDDPVWDHSTFSKNRDRLLEGAVAGRFLSAMLAQPRVKRLLSSEHFSVDGTLIEAWASMKSFRPKAEGPDDPEPPGGRNPDANFRGETRSNATHASTTDPDAKLYRKGPGMEARIQGRTTICAGCRSICIQTKRPPCRQLIRIQFYLLRKNGSTRESCRASMERRPLRRPLAAIERRSALAIPRGSARARVSATLVWKKPE